MIFKENLAREMPNLFHSLVEACCGQGQDSVKVELVLLLEMNKIFGLDSVLILTSSSRSNCFVDGQDFAEIQIFHWHLVKLATLLRSYGIFCLNSRPIGNDKT